MEEKIKEFNTKFLKKYEAIYKKNEIIRKKFINKYPIDTILKIPIEKYVIGNKNNDTFCYWIERKLRPLGSIQGGSTADKKFGVYYSKKYDNYIFAKKWNKSDNINTNYNNILQEIYELLKNGKDKNLESISINKISPMFKNKILCTYYPNNYLNVFSPEHINLFLDKLNIRYDKSLSIEEKRELLLRFRDNNNYMNKWNNFIFSCFLYKMFNPKEDKIISTESQIEYCLNSKDATACYVEKMKLVKERKINQKNLKYLKKMYLGKCQICGKNPVEGFEVDILECHHIEYFSKTQNNDMSNLLLVCPNHHTLIHKLNPTFNRNNLEYEFNNDKKMKIILNYHL